MKLLKVCTLLVASAVFCLASPIFVTFDNGGSYTNGSVYVGPYNLTLGVNPNTSPLFAPCFSDNLEVNGGETWYATEEGLTSYPWPSTPVFNDLKQIAWLDSNFPDTTEGSINPATVVPIQQAIWDLGNQISGTTQQYTDPATELWLSLALLNYGAGSTAFYNQFILLVPDQPTGSPYPILDAGATGPEPQFFIFEIVPEPLTFFLCGSGLLLLGLTKKLVKS